MAEGQIKTGNSITAISSVIIINIGQKIREKRLHMDNIFILKLLMSFIVGSIWVTTCTIVAERYGSKVGGFIVGLPSTILLGLFFIAWTQSTNIAVEATTVVPMVGGINCIFIVTYIMLVRLNFWLAIAGALLVWFVLSLVLVIFRFSSFNLSVGVYVVLLIFSYCFVEKILNVRSESRREVKLTFKLVLFRGFISGLIILLAVFLTKTGGPLIGGIFVMFPAMFLGTLLITYFSHGARFSSAVMKASIFGAISVVIYGIVARYTLIPLGIWFGTALSILISFFCAFVIHNVLTRKMS